MVLACKYTAAALAKGQGIVDKNKLTQAIIYGLAFWTGYQGGVRVISTNADGIATETRYPYYFATGRRRAQRIA